MASTMDWRTIIRRNNHRTFIIILLFILMYVSLGFIIDMFIYIARYRDLYFSYYKDTIFSHGGNPIEVIYYSLTHFKLIPYATILMGAFALISLRVVFKLQHHIILLGTEHHEVKPDPITAQQDAVADNIINKIGEEAQELLEEVHAVAASAETELSQPDDTDLQIATDPEESPLETAPLLKEDQLYDIVTEMKIAAGLQYMPRVFIIEADYMNAFASGFNQNNAMIAITRGLLNKLNRDEIEAVVAHEISHIHHMDTRLMITAAILANLMIIIVDVLYWSSRARRGSALLFGVMFVLRFLLPFVTGFLMLFLIRSREYMADAGSVELMRSSEPLGQALIKIQDDHSAYYEVYREQYNKSTHDALRREAYIFDPAIAGIKTKNKLYEYFSTHPSLDKRLAALGFHRKKN
jgi:heat shock protein HtpX